MRGRCPPYGAGLTYWPLGEILKGRAGVLDSDPPTAVLEKIRAEGEAILGERVAADPGRTVAALAYTVGVDDPEVRLREEAPRRVQAEIHDAWRLFFSSLALVTPATVVIEDIHWADPAMLDMLEELSKRVAGGLLFLCTARLELSARRPDWGGEAGAFRASCSSRCPPRRRIACSHRCSRSTSSRPVSSARSSRQPGATPSFSRKSCTS